MNQYFREGFEKTANEVAATLGMLSALGGLGALQGHAAHVTKKLMHARQGKQYKEESFIDKHPYLTGSVSLGLAPLLSAIAHQKDLDRDNPNVRDVMKKHPLMTMGM